MRELNNFSLKRCAVGFPRSWDANFDIEARLFSLSSLPQRRLCVPKFNPRQMEFHPSIGGRAVFGTTDYQLVVCNPYASDGDCILAQSPAAGSNVVLGLSWLKTGSY